MPVSPHDPRLAKCGFAKLLGPDVEVYMRKYELTIGRKSKSTALDVVLGDNMNISRLHAKICYNFATGRFELSVLGKNGVSVKGTLHTPNSAPVVLQSQDLIQIGESSFHFLLPAKIRSTSGKRKRPSSGATGIVDAEVTAAALPEDCNAPYQNQHIENNTQAGVAHQQAPPECNGEGGEGDEEVYEDEQEEEEVAGGGHGGAEVQHLYHGVGHPAGGQAAEQQENDDKLYNLHQSDGGYVVGHVNNVQHH